MIKTLIQTTGDNMTMTFTSKAEQKRELESLNWKYEGIRKSIMNTLLDERANRDETDPLYWAIPHNLFQFSAKVVAKFNGRFENEVAEILKLKKEREVIRAAEIVKPMTKKAKKEAEAVEATKCTPEELDAMKSVIREAFTGHKDTIKHDYKTFVRNTFNRMVDDLGPTLKGVHNSYRWARTYAGAIRSNTSYVDEAGKVTHCHLSDILAINEEKLEANSERYAKDVIEQWIHKISLKIGGVQNVDVKWFSAGGYFNITGTREGMNIRIEQQCIINCSKLGTLFHQFPARIYVDGKFMSAKKFKEMFN